ncbi:hypothetical protein QBC36DRAFT_355314 [Triangularia setosa]|uniref:Chromatin modification-related protein n=1 Tax=Triangularia setosa TaxID=2587417 RepID=A0AAN6W4H3_9PEZI|nr:hypothetical protein QBC36DRAFT_355314 [Podospora setosa]
MAAPEAIQPDVDEAISPRQDAPPSIEQAMQESIKSIENIAPLNPLDLRADPDAQATVSDFLDFTEYLPADMMRSLTLIGQLDQAYIDASSNIDDLTTHWGQLPGLPTGAKNKNTPVELRSQVSENLHHALNSRVYSHAEAQRMAENVNRHLNRAKTIFAKLQAMQDNYHELEEQQKSPVANKSPQMSRTPKIALKIDGQKIRRPRVPRITVPGEVLAPYDINFDAYTTGSESSSEEEEEEEAISSSRVTPAPRIKVVKGSSRPPKSSVPRAPRPRTSVPPPNVPGGLSTSAVMAQLVPPPENAVPGSADAPWCQLTAFELARLRKRMKKNAAWTPSDTMVARELAALGRGVDAFKAAKKKAEDEGRVFEGAMPVPTIDPHTGEKRMPLGALTVDALASDDKNITNRGMKLNEAKKLKREQLAKLAADEAEQSERMFREQARMIMGGVPQPAAVAEAKAIKSKAPKKRKRDSMPGTEAEGGEEQETAADGSQQAQRPQFKRTKTETPVPPPILTSGNSLGPPQETPVQLPQRTNAVLHSTTPIPLPNLSQDQSTTAKSASVISATSPASSITGPSSVPSLALIKLPTTETPIPPPVLSPKKSVTPILPPVRETRQKQVTRSQDQQQQPQPQQLSPLAVSAAAGKVSSRTASPELVAPKPDPDAAPAPAPSASTVVTRRPASRGKATSQEPALPHHPPQTSSLAADRPRRASTARNTPEVAAASSSNTTTTTSATTSNTTATASTAPVGNATATRPASKRAGKRPAPGVISRTNSGGNSAVGTRKAAPRKKQSATAGSRTAGKKEKEIATTPVENTGHGAEVEVDDEGNVIDPEEPRYCLCNRVSFGTMIQCDNIDQCKQEWFHLECVGLSDIPARTTKWYCPDCRKALKIGEKGEVSARGVRA